MRLVLQKHKNGCASACLAMIANISYAEAIKLLKPNRKKGQVVSSSIIDLCLVLKKMNFKFLINIEKSIKKIKNYSILVISTKNKNYHACVWDPKNKKILDPWKKCKFSKYEKSLILAIEIENPNLS